MPEVVLRHPDVPQPLVVDVAPGQYLDPNLEAAGWEIDDKTAAEDARVEINEVVEAAAAKAAEAAATFVPEFPPTPDVTASPAPAQAPVSSPAEPVTPESAPADLDLSKGN